MSSTTTIEPSEWAAPFLPSLDVLPDCPEVVPHVAEYPAYKHNGRTSCRDAERCCRVIELRLMGWGKKRIAVELKMSKWTVQAIWDDAQKRGILAPYKEQFDRKAGEIALDGLDVIHEGMFDATVPLHQKSIAWGIVLTQKAANAGTGFEMEVAKGPNLSVEGMNGFFAAPPPDFVSSGLTPVSEQSGSLLADGASAGASSTTPAVQEEGGGGDRVSGPGGAGADVSESGEPLAKGSSGGSTP